MEHKWSSVADKELQAGAGAFLLATIGKDQGTEVHMKRPLWLLFCVFFTALSLASPLGAQIHLPIRAFFPEKTHYQGELNHIRNIDFP